MQKQGIFFRALANRDSMPTLTKIKNELGCSWIAIRVQGGTGGIQQFNYKSALLKDDKWLENYFRDAETPGVKVWLYHEILGSDPALEARKLLARISPYMHKSAFGGVIAVVGDGFNIRTTNAVKVYSEALAGVNLNWLNLAMTLKKELIDAWNYYTGHGLRLVTSWKQCHDDFVSYGIDNRFIPVWGICDLPALFYKFTEAASVDFWARVMSSDMPAVGMWNAQPYDDVPGIFSDGSSLIKIAAKLRWIRSDVITPPDDEPVDPPVSTDPTGEEIRRVLNYLIGKY
jgi:hypothetical protein